MAIPRTAHLTTLGVVIAVGLSCTIGASGAVATPASSTTTRASATVTDASIPAPVVQRIDTEANGTQRMLGTANSDRVEVLDGDTVVSAWPAGMGFFSIAVGERYRDTELTIVAERTVDGTARRSEPVVLPRTLQVDGVDTKLTSFTPGQHEFSGTATAGATITATDVDGTELFRAEVPSSRAAAPRAASVPWSAEADLGDTSHTITFTQTTPSGIPTVLADVRYLPSVAAVPTVDDIDRGVRGEYFLRGSVGGEGTRTVVATVGEDRYTAEVRDGAFLLTVPGSHVGATAQVASESDDGPSKSTSVELPAAPEDADIAAPTVRDVFNLPNGEILVTGDAHAPGAIWFLHGDRVVAGTNPDGGFSYRIGSDSTDQQIDMATMQFGKISERTALPRLLSVDGVTDRENSFVPGTQTFTGRAEAGATVTARDADGTELFSVEASGTKAGVGSWSAQADLSAGSHELTFTQTTRDGRTSVMQDIGFTSDDEAPVAPVVVTGPTEGSTVTSKRPVFAGTGAEGATIVVKGSSRQVATTTVEDGTWSVPADFDLGDGDYRLWVTQTPTSGAEPTTVEVTFTVRHAAVAPLVVTGPAEGSTVTSKRPVFEGTGAEGATIVVKGSSRQVATTTVEDGTWSVPADFDLGNGDYRLWVTQTPTGGAEPTTVEVTFTVRHAAVAPLVVTGPAEGSTVTSKRPVFSGTGAEGATIVVKGSSRQVATTTVEDGTWSVPADFDLGNGEYRLWITQTPTGGAEPTTVEVTFRITAG